MKDLDILHEEIRLCRGCITEGYLTEPPPLVWGSAPAPFMLIGQAPSRTDQMVRHLYSGPAAQRLLAWLRDAGFTDQDFGTTLYMTALTKCFPGRLPGKSTDRAPSARELALCSHWLKLQIEMVQPKVIILFGKMAIDSFLGADAMTTRIGQLFESGGVEYIPLPHSSGASTWLNSSENKSRLVLALNLLHNIRERYQQR